MCYGRRRKSKGVGLTFVGAVIKGVEEDFRKSKWVGIEEGHKVEGVIRGSLLS